MNILNLVKAVVAGATIAVAVTATARYLAARHAKKGVEQTFGEVSKEDAAKMEELSAINLPAGKTTQEEAVAYVKAKMTIIAAMDNLKLAKASRSTVSAALMLKKACEHLTPEAMLEASKGITDVKLKGE